MATRTRLSRAIEAWIDPMEATLAHRAIPADGAVARRWGEMSAARSPPGIDKLSAATAIGRGVALVARDTRDMASSAVAVFKPWHAG